MDKDDGPGAAVREFAPNAGETAISVWDVGDELQYLDDVVVAIASGWEKKAKLAYVVFPEQPVRDAGIRVQASPGKTPYAEASHLHRDIDGLTARKVGDVTAIAYSQQIKQELLEPHEVLECLVQAIRGGKLKLSSLDENSRLTAEIVDQLEMP